MEQTMIEKLTQYGTHLACLLDTSCRIVDIQNHCFASEPLGKVEFFGEYCCNKHCTQLHTCLYGCHEAYRWNGKYIFYCPEGFVFVAASVSDKNGELSGGVVLGPMIMGELDDTLSQYQSTEMADHVGKLSNFSTEKVNHIAEITAAVTTGVCGFSRSLMGGIAFKQEKILQDLYDAQHKDALPYSDVYPIETEKKLQAVIYNGDKNGAQALLNDLLGQIYLISKFDVEIIKIRMIELLSVMSRATIDAGADSNEIIWFNTSCIQEMQKCSSIEEVSVWITSIMQRFINYSFDFSSVKHSDTVYKVIEYIRRNYFQKITLDDIARYVHFSKTYLSRIFKEETGENISSYINKVRIEKAKMLLSDKSISLVDVSNLTGFEDQSYFTKVFKLVTGISPKKFKESRSKI